MTTKSSERIVTLIKNYESDLLDDWVKKQTAAATFRPDLMREPELRNQSKEFVSLFSEAIQSENLEDIMASVWTKVREFLEGISISREEQ